MLKNAKNVFYSSVINTEAAHLECTFLSSKICQLVFSFMLECQRNCAVAASQANLIRWRNSNLCRGGRGEGWWEPVNALAGGKGGD